ncbi:hypothetical protein N9E91_01285 [Alphaproteobacteria bacterium]|nr:hypothetical protein [Alphaproteobacteria bacterium]
MIFAVVNVVVERLGKRMRGLAHLQPMNRPAGLSAISLAVMLASLALHHNGHAANNVTSKSSNPSPEMPTPEMPTPEVRIPEVRAPETVIGSTPVQTPANAYRSGNGWRCRTGFFKMPDGQCRKVIVPANAIISGNSWRCVPGYLRIDAACQRPVVPAYGFIKNNAVRCTAGFELVRKDKATNGVGAFECRAIDLPAKAFMRGNRWECLPGYVRKEAGCSAINAPADSIVRGNSWSCRTGLCALIIAASAFSPLQMPPSGATRGAVMRALSGMMSPVI